MVVNAIHGRSFEKEERKIVEFFYFSFVEFEVFSKVDAINGRNEV